MVRVGPGWESGEKVVSRQKEAFVTASPTLTRHLGRFLFIDAIYRTALADSSLAPSLSELQGGRHGDGVSPWFR